MTQHEEPDLLNTVLQLLISKGSVNLAECFRLLLNEAMHQERSSVLRAQPYERCEGRLGHANGFYPSALERGVRSEQALTLAMAEMYVQGVSTRKVSKIVEELCGHQVSSAQVSACVAKLDVQLQLWRERPLGACPYLIFDARYEKVRHGGLLVDCAVLTAIGIGTDGKRTILRVSVALSEAEASFPHRSHAVCAAPSSSSATRIQAWQPPAKLSSPPCPGNAASSISSKTPRPMCLAQNKTYAAKSTNFCR